MTTLEIQILPSNQIPPELQAQIDALDHLAFADENPHKPDPDPVQWAAHDWMAIGTLDGVVAVQFCLLKREILVGAQLVEVAGVGGVATQPDQRRKGYAAQLLTAAGPFMREQIGAPFGLLICAEETQPVYARCGWQTVARSLTFIQNGQPRRMDPCVMILPLAGRQWLPGEINLQGLPW